MTPDEAANTDREIWRGPDEGNGAYYADSVHITKDGALGINCGGRVIVKTPRAWQEAALLEADCQWQPIETAPKDQWVLLYDALLRRCVVAQWMTAIEDGSGDWVLARRLGSDGLAFVSRDATHWRHLPREPRP